MVVGGEVGHVFVLGSFEMGREEKGGMRLGRSEALDKGREGKGLGDSEGPTGRLEKGYKTTRHWAFSTQEHALVALITIKQKWIW